MFTLNFPKCLNVRFKQHLSIEPVHLYSVSRQKQPAEVFYKKGVLENFAIFTGKHLCQSFIFSAMWSTFSTKRFCSVFYGSTYKF